MTNQPPVHLDPAITEILNRCYKTERKRDVIARAVRMLATADGHLTPDGRVKSIVGARPGARRTP